MSQTRAMKVMARRVATPMPAFWLVVSFGCGFTRSLAILDEFPKFGVLVEIG